MCRPAGRSREPLEDAAPLARHWLGRAKPGGRVVVIAEHGRQERLRAPMLQGAALQGLNHQMEAVHEQRSGRPW
jgi:hypothetical protein